MFVPIILGAWSAGKIALGAAAAVAGAATGYGAMSFIRDTWKESSAEYDREHSKADTVKSANRAPQIRRINF